METYRLNLLWIIGLALVVAGAVGSPAVGDDAGPVTTVEEMNEVKLPHGIAVLPLGKTSEAKQLGGEIFRFADAAHGRMPEEGVDNKRLTPAGIYAQVRDEKIGDVTYTPLNGGTLVAWSGRAADLGDGLLSGLSGKNLDDPPAVFSKKERSGNAPQGYEGFLESVVEGHRYLLKTTDGKYALLRLLEESRNGAVIQWVLQTDGGQTFDIPPSEAKAYERRWKGAQPADAERPAETNSAATKTLEALHAGIAQHLAARAALIKELLAVVARDTEEQRGVVSAKTLAIQTLGTLRAAEAAPALVKTIDHMDPNLPTRAETLEAIYPTLRSLIMIGKQGSLSALAGIREAHRWDAGGDENRRLARIQLLALVVVGVEGSDVARFMLEREIGRAEDQAKPALKEALEYVTEPR